MKKEMKKGWDDGTRDSGKGDMFRELNMVSQCSGGFVLAMKQSERHKTFWNTNRWSERVNVLY
jgi:hypothetical protein